MYDIKENSIKPAKFSLPALPKVPGMSGDPLIIRLSHTGATLLKEGSFKKRFTGGESVVDINGNLYLTRKDYKNALKKEAEDRENWKQSLGFTKKNPRPKKIQPGEIIDIKDREDTGNNPIEKKKYRLNKTEVINRIQSMTNAVFSAKKTSSFLGMLTVTFPPAVNEDIAMQALNTWLTSLRRKGQRSIREYLWVSEFQDGKRLDDSSKATNTIHYHLLILNRVNIVKVNRAMRVVLCNLIRDGVLNYPLAVMKRYNGVDLAKNRKTKVVTNFCDPKSRKLLSWYITKYVAKNNAAFKHSAWGCSRGFSAIFTAITCTYKELIRKDWHNLLYFDPVISTQWFDFFPWYHDTGPPAEFVAYMAQVNQVILEKRGLLN